MTWGLAEWRSLAPLSRFGVLVLGVGAGLDAVVHVRAGSFGAPIGFTPAQHSAHLVILIGMLSTLIGVVLNAIWPSRPEEPRHP
jgi:hypothetical protein